MYIKVVFNVVFYCNRPCTFLVHKNFRLNFYNYIYRYLIQLGTLFYICQYSFMKDTQSETSHPGFFGVFQAD